MTDELLFMALVIGGVAGLGLFVVSIFFWACNLILGQGDKGGSDGK